MKTTRIFPVAFATAVLAASAGAVPLSEYARLHPLPVHTVAPGATVPIGRDQTNNLQDGDKLLALSGCDLTALDGISTLMVQDAGQSTPITSVAKLHLFLNRNRLETVPAEIAALKNVIFIYLNQNRLRALPPDIARMENLRGIYCSANRFTEVPAFLFAMTWLKKLQFSENTIETLPAQLGDLHELVHLNMGRNHIATLPATIGNLTRLRVCDFSHNQLRELPEGFGRVKIVHQLRVGGNPLTSLPAGFAEMPGTIDISDTHIELAQLAPALRAKISKEKHSTKPSLVKAVEPAK